MALRQLRPDPSRRADEGAQVTERSPRAVPGLKARALRLLSRREFSRHELSRRLAPHAASADELQRVLDEVQARRFQSDERFTASLVHRRASQFGSRRIEFELEQHRIEGSTAARVLTDLADTERERAMAVWQRRFRTPAADLSEKARQYRFLAQRGFDSETINWVLKQAVFPSKG